MPITKATASSIAPAAKGDLVVGSATNDASILAVGTNTHVLTADSAEATGLKWAAAAGFGTLTAYTPTWTNITIGNGTFQDVGYSQSGDLVWYYGMFTFGSTTTSSGIIELSLPVNADSTASNTQGRSPVWNLATFADISTGYTYKLQTAARNADPADRMQFMMLLTNSTYLFNDSQGFQQTVPVTFGTSDTIWWNVMYKKA